MQNFIAIFLSKLSSKLIKTLNLGRGSALPGRIALKISPQIVKEYAKQFQTSNLTFFISGTNGKTTTAGLLKSILDEHLLNSTKTISNAFGANLYYGIVAELINSASLLGKIEADNFVLETDEAALRTIAQDLKAKNILLTNIFRDQLDRFGEIDYTQKLLAKGIEINQENDQEINLFLNAQDSKLYQIAEQINNPKTKIFFYSVNNLNLTDYDKIVSRNDLVIHLSCNILKQNSNSSTIEILVDEQKAVIELNLPGNYNVYNACAASIAAYYNGVSLENIKQGIENYHSAFGRAKLFKYHNKNLQTFLIKNPTGCTEVLKYIANNNETQLVIALNDDYADGRDVSWIWDAEFNLISNLRSVICSGTRAEDIALRLKYAGVEPTKISIEKNLPKAITMLTSRLDSQEKGYVLPTYTALLEINSKIKESCCTI